MSVPTAEQINRVYDVIETALGYANNLVFLTKYETPPASVDLIFKELVRIVLLEVDLKSLGELLSYIESHNFPHPCGNHPSVAESAAIRIISVCMATALRNVENCVDMETSDCVNGTHEITDFLCSLSADESEKLLRVSRDWHAVIIALGNTPDDNTTLGWLGKERLQVLKALETETEKPPEPQSDGWLTLAAVARGFGWTTKSGKPDSKRVTRLIESDTLTDNGETSRKRKVSRSSVNDYMKENRLEWSEDNAMN